jgi:hypothetical protein
VGHVNQEHDYVSYLLRLWQVGGKDERVWRASLECPRTGKRESFASLADLFAFLTQNLPGSCHSGSQRTLERDSGATGDTAH